MSKHFIFVVEGKNDASRLKQVGVNNVIMTEGSKVSRETIYYLRVLEKKHNIVILTDSDGPGLKIREKIASNLKDPIIINLSKDEMIGKNDIGVENIPLPKLAKILEPYLKTKHITTSDISYSWLIAQNYSGPQSKAKRKAIGERHNIPYASLKKMFEAITLLNLMKEELYE